MNFLREVSFEVIQNYMVSSSFCRIISRKDEIIKINTILIKMILGKTARLLCKNFEGILLDLNGICIVMVTR